MPQYVAEEGKRWAAFNEEVQKAGIVVSNGGLQGVDNATTVRVRDGETQITDGPVRGDQGTARRLLARHRRRLERGPGGGRSHPGHR